MEEGPLIQLSDIKKGLRFFISSIPWIAASAILGAIAGFAYLYVTPKNYVITASLIYNPYGPEEENYGLFSKFDYNYFYVDVSNQVNKIKSYDLISKVLEEVDYTIEYYIKGRVRTAPLYKSSPFTIKAQVIDSRLYEKPIKVRITAPDEITLFIETEGEMLSHPIKLGKDYTIPGIIKIRAENSYISQSNFPQLSEVDYYIILYPMDKIINRIIANLEVNNVEYTSVINIKYKDYIPERGIAFLNKLAEMYIQSTIEKYFIKVEKQIAFIDLYSTRMEKMIDSIYEQKEAIQKHYQTVSVEREYSAMIENFFKEKENQRNLNERLQILGELQKQIENFEPDREVIPYPGLSEIYIDKFLMDGLNQLYALRQQYLSLSSNIKNLEFPTFYLIKQKSDSLKKILIHYSKALKKRYENLLEISKQNEKEYMQNILSNNPTTRTGYRSIERKMGILENLLTDVYKQKISMQLKKEGILPETKVIEKARIMDVMEPVASRVYMYTVLTCIIIGFTFFTVRHFTIRKITDKLEIFSITGTPVVASLPFIDSKKPEETLEKLQPYIKIVLPEILYLQNTEKLGGLMLVSSMRASVGKTTVSTLLAYELSKIGKKTLLVDLDLFRKTLSGRYDLTSKPGIINMISTPSSENTLPLDNYISMIEDGVYLLPVGFSSSDPFYLLFKENTVKIIERLRNEFELVILDLFPLSLLNVPTGIALRANAVLLVLTYDDTPYLNLLNLEKIIKKNKIADKCFIIINKVKESKITTIMRKVTGKKDKEYYGSYYSLPSYEKYTKT